MRTGRASGAAVLDVDVKYPATAYGFDSLAELGFAVLPDTPMTHTASGGLHLWFDPGGREIPNTQGAKGRGIGPGLDWRGEGGFVILPSPDSGYCWDPRLNLDTLALAPIPPVLLPREPQRQSSGRPLRPATGLSPYAEAALDSACRRIVEAPPGEQEATLNGEAFAIGTLAGAGGIPGDFARRALIWAARRIPDYDRRRPWRGDEIERKVARAFAAGLAHPRQEARHG